MRGVIALNITRERSYSSHAARMARDGGQVLNTYFEDASRIRALKRGPIGPFMDGLAASLAKRGYARNSGRAILETARNFSVYACMTGVRSVDGISPNLLEKFIEDEIHERRHARVATNALRHLTDHLRAAGAVHWEAHTPAAPQGDGLLESFRSHLQTIRGVSRSTVNAYATTANEFLVWLHPRLPRNRLSRLSGKHVLTFMLETVAEEGGRRRHVAGNLRAFLRFLKWEELVENDLSVAVPRVPRWRLKRVPKGLPWHHVRMLVDSIDTTHPDGLRDKAIIVLIARLGLRAGEVTKLKLEDVSWREGMLTLRKTKNGKERCLPMPREVGASLADYVVHGRPTVAGRELFLRHKAPVGVLASGHAIGSILRRHLRASRIPTPPTFGPHMLRHSLATELVNKSVPIKTIADLLGHGSIDTTAIYTKVDVKHLADAAMSFPEAAQ